MAHALTKVGLIYKRLFIVGILFQRNPTQLKLLHSTVEFHSKWPILTSETEAYLKPLRRVKRKRLVLEDTAVYQTKTISTEHWARPNFKNLVMEHVALSVPLLWVFSTTRPLRKFSLIGNFWQALHRMTPSELEESIEKHMKSARWGKIRQERS